MRTRQTITAAVLSLVMALSSGIGARAQGTTCSREDFETTVEKSADVLREISQQNAPQFQALLRKLKEKKGWTHDQFVREAEPLVRDDTIVGYDQKSEELLLAINMRGQDSSSGAPDCALLAELRANMAALVEIQKAKWAYMFGKVNAALR
jgi:hypothetical protein